VKILFDHGTPAPLRHALKGHFVSTAYEAGWSELDNGALLSVAGNEFDVIVVDRPEHPAATEPRRTPAGDIGFTNNKLARNSNPSRRNLSRNRSIAARRLRRNEILTAIAYALIRSISASETSKLA
jgi:hypothetical protein